MENLLLTHLLAYEIIWIVIPLNSMMHIRSMETAILAKN